MSNTKAGLLQTRYSVEQLQGSQSRTQQQSIHVLACRRATGGEQYKSKPATAFQATKPPPSTKLEHFYPTRLEVWSTVTPMMHALMHHHGNTPMMHASLHHHGNIFSKVSLQSHP